MTVVRAASTVSDTFVEAPAGTARDAMSFS